MLVYVCIYLYIHMYVYRSIFGHNKCLSQSKQCMPYILIALHTHVCNFDSAGITPNYISVFNYHVTHLIIFNQHPSFLSLSAH